MKISQARTGAFDILARIDGENAFSSILLPQVTARLSDADRSLCYELVLGSLRRQIYLDAVISHFAGEKKLDPEVRTALRLGLFQIIFLDRVPAHAAINESVNLVLRSRKRSARGFVNAILRKASAGVPELKFEDPVGEICVMTSHPRWLVSKWVAEFGFEAASAICNANNKPVSPAFRLTSRYFKEFGRSKATIEKICSDLGLKFGSIRESGLVADCYFADEDRKQLRLAAEKGYVYFQDAGSQLVANAVQIRPGRSLLDLCASPGGKVTKIASEVEMSDFIFVAADVSTSRVSNLKANCINQGLESVNVLQLDATRELPFSGGSFDAVLVDAPCTGTGTIRHNPEIRYRVNSEDIHAKQEKQRRILENASKAVKVGGSLMYATCSLEREENEGVVSSFLTGNKTFALRKPSAPGRFIQESGYLRTFPSDFEGDGFFMATFIRNAE